jgi:hypothetical protein
MLQEHQPLPASFDLAGRTLRRLRLLAFGEIGGLCDGGYTQDAVFE